MAAIDEARDLDESGANPTELAEMLRHARELLDILEEEAAAQSIAIPADAHAVLDQLRNPSRSFGEGRRGELALKAGPTILAAIETMKDAGAWVNTVRAQREAR